jgi:hypothetical protein
VSVALVIAVREGSEGVAISPNATFGAVLRRHRVAAGLTQEEMAERAGLSVRGLSHLAAGEGRIRHPREGHRSIACFRDARRATIGVYQLDPDVPDATHEHRIIRQSCAVAWLPKSVEHTFVAFHLCLLPGHLPPGA